MPELAPAQVCYIVGIIGRVRTDDPHHHNKQADIDHLVGHYWAGRDVFVTNDGRIEKKEAVAGAIWHYC